MKVIVDTSVWSPALRLGAKSTDQNVRKLGQLLEEEQAIYLLGVILLEILQGLKQQQLFQQVRRYLEPFPLVEPSRADYAFAAELGFNCARNGIQATTIDCLIAAAAIQYDCFLLSSDRDFRRMAAVAPLQLL